MSSDTSLSVYADSVMIGLEKAKTAISTRFIGQPDVVDLALGALLSGGRLPRAEPRPRRLVDHVGVLLPGAGVVHAAHRCEPSCVLSVAAASSCTFVSQWVAVLQQAHSC